MSHIATIAAVNIMLSLKANARPLHMLRPPPIEAVSLDPAEGAHSLTIRPDGSHVNNSFLLATLAFDSDMPICLPHFRTLEVPRIGVVQIMGYVRVVTFLQQPTLRILLTRLQDKILLDDLETPRSGVQP